MLFAQSDGQLFPSAHPIDQACNGSVSRAASSEAFTKLKPGQSLSLEFPSGLASKKLVIMKLDRTAQRFEAQRAGASIAKQASNTHSLILCQGCRRLEDIVFGAKLRDYRFDRHKNDKKNETTEMTFCVRDPEAAKKKCQPHLDIAAGIIFGRDLVNEPANILNTDSFVSRLEDLRDDGIEVKILNEDELKNIGMRALLAVGQGSTNPSYVAIMEWKGAASAPLVLAGKGVVFDTGGISLKPATKMELMTMDMAGAATVAGVMKAIARRGAKAHVIGIVGLVENMPGGQAQRPGDVIRSLKGDTIEVINTDAEGRLVLADLLWYAQSQYEPLGIIDLATLTGAIIVSLGSEFAGLFSNHNKFCAEFLAAAHGVGEKAWRMPLDPSFDKLLKSRIADLKNVGGREAGASVAAHFLQRFVKPTMPWIHLDIAGVALSQRGTELSPSGATGWGIQTINQLILNHYEER